MLRLEATGPLDMGAMAIVQATLAAHAGAVRGVILDYRGAEDRLTDEDWAMITRSGIRTATARFPLPVAYVVPAGSLGQALHHAWTLVCAGAVRAAFTGLSSARRWISMVAWQARDGSARPRDRQPRPDTRARIDSPLGDASPV